MKVDFDEIGFVYETGFDELVFYRFRATTGSDGGKAHA